MKLYTKENTQNVHIYKGPRITLISNFSITILDVVVNQVLPLVLKKKHLNIQYGMQGLKSKGIIKIFSRILSLIRIKSQKNKF